jgi:DegV family protein with EDD domain
MIKLLIDSSAYLTRAEAAQMGVILMPMTYSTDDGAMYTEGFVDENIAFDRLLQRATGRMHTSQVTYAALAGAFQALTGGGHDVLCMTMSSRLSGTYANARMASEKVGGKRVLVVDTQMTGGAFYALVRRAYALAAAGESIAAVARAVHAARGKIHTFFSVDDMAALRGSGRLGNVKLSVSTMLNIRPILKLEGGGITSHAVARGRTDQIKALCATVPDGARTVIVQHNHAATRAGYLAAELSKRGFASTVRSVGPVLAIHLGEGALGVSFET